MRDKDRIVNVLSELKALWELYPDLRFIQLVDWIKSEINTYSGQCDFYTEDPELRDIIQKMIREAK